MNMSQKSKKKVFLLMEFCRAVKLIRSNKTPGIDLVAGNTMKKIHELVLNISEFYITIALKQENFVKNGRKVE